uniref:Uncharacterized protein n=1 Tax=Arundo donax TaxID=35708 RepID=A0A0A8ZQ19_ARUDO
MEKHGLSHNSPHVKIYGGQNLCIASKVVLRKNKHYAVFVYLKTVIGMYFST